MLWTGLVWGKARKHGYNQVENYKTRQDKTRYDNPGELRALLIHQLVLVCWRAVPQTISFCNPKPSYLEMSRHGCTAALLQRYQVCTTTCCNAAKSTLLHATTLPNLHCCMLQRWDMAALLVPTFVLSDPGHDTLHIRFEKVMVMFTQLNEVYVAIHKLVKVHLAMIVLKNHRHVYVEANCHLSTLLEKNGHIDPKIKNQTMTYVHTNACLPPKVIFKTYLV